MGGTWRRVAMGNFFGVAACFVAFAGSGAAESSAAEASAAEASAVGARAAGPADLLVELALQAGAGGDVAECEDRLREALQVDACHPLANGHLGRVRAGGAFVPVDEVWLHARRDDRLAEYARRRDAAWRSGDVDAEFELFRQCGAWGFADRQTLHGALTLAHPRASDKQRREVVQRLDLRPWGDGWLTGAELRALEAEQHALRTAWETWAPRLAAWRDELRDGKAPQRARALEQLRGLNDPASLPCLEALAGDPFEPFALEVVALLKRFRQHEATEALAAFALASPSSPARQAAVLALRDRPPHEYVPALLAELRAPIQTRVSLERDATGNLAYRHAFYQEGPHENHFAFKSRFARAFTHTTSTTTVHSVNTTYFRSIFPNFKKAPVTTELHSTKTTKSLRPSRERGSNTGQQAVHENDMEFNALLAEQRVAKANQQIEWQNQRLFEVLEGALLIQQPRDAATWWRWWNEHNSVARYKPTRFQASTMSFDYLRLRRSFRSHEERVGAGWAWSCFPAGVLVWTETGLAPIDSIRVGDRVLSQHPDTGELAFKMVLTTTLRPPSPLARLTVQGETLPTTLGHPFWRPRDGWRMAKELRPGDLLHGVTGSLRLDAAEPLADQAAAYNLVAQDFHTYFVGETGLLAHDVTPRAPTTAVVPGLHPR